MAIYESEHTKFIREWLEKHPQELEEQRKGRALWWDKPQDVEEQAKLDESKVPPKPCIAANASALTAIPSVRPRVVIEMP